MAVINERIQFFRKLRGMTQKELGLAIGFQEKGADNRIAQYEGGYRTPKPNIISKLAEALQVSPLALSVPTVDTFDGLMHLLFALEDEYGLGLCKNKEEAVCLSVDTSKRKITEQLHQRILEWQEKANEVKQGKISKKEYDKWRYCYPKYREGDIF